ncbi:MAG: heavy-metal-associated domain-containing protein [Anaerolineales bacterium]|nr:heavy-metal-associated domain-containing protein [Anaerolineales bacterium]
MAMITFELPMMYGDHHVIEVRKLLKAVPGIDELYASSSFQILEIQFDEQQVTEDEIRARLETAGYLGELALPAETGSAATETDGQPPYFRKTAVFAQTGKTVSFAQQVSYEGRPLWPCPGTNK